MKAACALLVGATACAAAPSLVSAGDLPSPQCNANEFCAGTGVLAVETNGGGGWMLEVECDAVAVDTALVIATGETCSVTGADNVTYWSQPTTSATWQLGNKVYQAFPVHNVPMQAYTLCIQGNYQTINNFQPGWVAPVCTTLVVSP